MFVKELSILLLHTVIVWPTGEALVTVRDGFLQTWGFPQCGGAVDGTHIPIVAPPQSSADYYNRKGFYSIVLQAVVDHQYMYDMTDMSNTHLHNYVHVEMYRIVDVLYFVYIFPSSFIVLQWIFINMKKYFTM